MDDGFEVTERWLREHANGRAGWSAAQLRVLGIQWPPTKGWIRRLVGKKIAVADKIRFEGLRKSKAVDDETNDQRRCAACSDPFPVLHDFEGKLHCPSCYVKAFQARIA